MYHIKLILKVTGWAALLLALAIGAWVEWSVLSSGGFMWGMFFGGFIIPFCLFATLGLLPKELLARE
ncbi:hypothetical protein [Geomonas propionica]|uniref:Uncharacterized protein n=1 Tax=Geomonas propionica TaxID=2798582 RepID=A0ABS0YPZ1_9BACT|nr:hypothetical protein [Geomonas propionica]MBJ6799993.1 hypothetical protein [Geomonas propionica]